MPRSFLVKRGSLHLLRHVARSPSPASTQDECSQLDKNWAGAAEPPDEKPSSAPLGGEPSASSISGNSLPQTFPHKGEGRNPFTGHNHLKKDFFFIPFGIVLCLKLQSRATLCGRVESRTKQKRGAWRRDASRRRL